MQSHQERGRVIKMGNPLQTGNNTPLLSNIKAPQPQWILNIRPDKRSLIYMKHILLSLAAAGLLALSAPSAQAAECFADYKAKQENPLRLHYGVAQVSGDCSRASAQTQLTDRLAANGWTLLTIVSVFGKDGLNQRKASAGPNFLRF